jgi:hypothetical protein
MIISSTRRHTRKTMKNIIYAMLMISPRTAPIKVKVSPLEPQASNWLSYLINKSECVSVCMYVQEKTIYIVALLHNNWIVRHCYIFLLTQQLKQRRFYGR